MYVCMCIYICAVGSITWPSKVNNLAVSFFLFFKILLHSAGRMRFLKKQVLTKKKCEKSRVNNLAIFLGKILAKKMA